jgi:DDE_Tnp_1-associated
MSQVREKRRIAGALRKGLAQCHFEQIVDPRGRRGRRWKLTTLLKAVVVGMSAGCTSLKAVESLTAEFSVAMRRWLGIFSRVPDTTLRDALCLLTPEMLRPALHYVVKAASRRKALAPQELPFGVVSLDGKGFCLPACDDWYAQRQTHEGHSPLRGVVRTVTAVLTSIAARPVIDVLTIPADTNEMGRFEAALRALMLAYKGIDLFRLVTYDAGACSRHNAQLVRALGLHYLFAIKGSQPALLDEIRRVLGTRADAARNDMTEERVGSDTVIRRVFLEQAGASSAPEGWAHLSTLVRVSCETRNNVTGATTLDNRFFVSSLPLSRMTAAQWLLVVRSHWAVELAHQTLDVALLEDDHPWITANPRAAAVIAVLRRTTYTLLALFRSVTQRSEQRRSTPWKDLMRAVDIALLTFSASDSTGLRHHRVRAPS